MTGVRVVDAQHAQDHRVFRARGVPVRVDAELHRAAAQHALARVSRTGSATTAASSATISWITTTVVAPRPATRASRTGTTAGGARRACTSRVSATSASARTSSCAVTATRFTPRAAAGRAASTARSSAPTSRTRSRGPGEWSLYMEGYGETLPYHDNRMWLSPDKPDAWGMPRHQDLDELSRQRDARWRSR